MPEKEKIQISENTETLPITLSEKIILLSKAPDCCIRVDLAKALADEHNELSEKILLSLSDDPDELVRTNACDSLYWSNSRSTLEKLLEIMTNDTYLVIGYAMLSAADIIVNNGYYDYIDKIKSIMKREKSKFVLMNYYSFLYRMGNHEYLYKISENLNARKYTDRCHAANLLADTVKEEDSLIAAELMKERLSKEKTFAVKSTLQKLIKNTEAQTLE